MKAIKIALFSVFTLLLPNYLYAKGKKVVIMIQTKRYTRRLSKEKATLSRDAEKGFR